MCVTSLLCGPRADLWPIYGFLCKQFSLYTKVKPLYTLVTILFVEPCFSYVFNEWPPFPTPRVAAHRQLTASLCKCLLVQILSTDWWEKICTEVLRD